MDEVCFRILQGFFLKYFEYFSKQSHIKFEGFSDLELITLLTSRFYILYCEKNDFSPSWDENSLNYEREKVNNYSFMKKYFEFEVISNEFEKVPFSSFNFPKEEGQERFVFYFYLNSTQLKDKIFEILNKIDLRDEIVDILKTKGAENKILNYAIGFSYKIGKLYRVTLYSAFSNPYDARGNLLFIEKLHGLKVKEELQNLWHYAIDFYDDREEYKIYENSHFFMERLNDKELNKIFFSKVSTKVLKYLDKKIKSVKYEFDFSKVFSKEELDALMNRHLYDDRFRILAIYVKDKMIVHSVMYNL